MLPASLLHVPVVCQSLTCGLAWIDRDVNINVFMPGAEGLIGEVQVHLKAFDDTQARLRDLSIGGQTGHDRYAIFRRINERLAFQRSRLDQLLGGDKEERGGEPGDARLRQEVVQLREESVQLRADVGELKAMMGQLMRQNAEMLQLLRAKDDLSA